MKFIVWLCGGLVWFMIMIYGLVNSEGLWNLFFGIMAILTPIWPLALFGVVSGVLLWGIVMGLLSVVGQFTGVPAW